MTLIGHDEPSLELRIAQMQKSIRALENGESDAIAFDDGIRNRVIVGLQPDGKYGIRIYDNQGNVAFSNVTNP